MDKDQDNLPVLADDPIKALQKAEQQLTEIGITTPQLENLKERTIEIKNTPDNKKPDKIREVIFKTTKETRGNIKQAGIHLTKTTQHLDLSIEGLKEIKELLDHPQRQAIDILQKSLEAIRRHFDKALIKANFQEISDFAVQADPERWKNEFSRTKMEDYDLKGQSDFFVAAKVLKNLIHAISENPDHPKILDMLEKFDGNIETKPFFGEKTPLGKIIRYLAAQLYTVQDSNTNEIELDFDYLINIILRPAFQNEKTQLPQNLITLIENTLDRLHSELSEATEKPNYQKLIKKWGKIQEESPTGLTKTQENILSSMNTERKAIESTIETLKEHGNNIDQLSETIEKAVQQFEKDLKEPTQETEENLPTEIKPIFQKIKELETKYPKIETSLLYFHTGIGVLGSIIPGEVIYQLIKHFPKIGDPTIYGCLAWLASILIYAAFIPASFHNKLIKFIYQKIFKKHYLAIKEALQEIPPEYLSEFDEDFLEAVDINKENSPGFLAEEEKETAIETQEQPTEEITSIE